MKLGQVLKHGIEAMLALCLLGMVICVFGNVLLRYFLGTGWVVSEELSRLLFVWLVCLSAILAFGENKHLGFDLLTARLSGASAALFIAVLVVSKKYWDGLSKDEQKVLMDAAVKSRDFERKDTRAKAEKALTELKSKGMQVNQLSPTEASRMRDQLTRINATIATNVGMDLWQETQAAVTKARAAK
jgi:hypothetical protein